MRTSSPGDARGCKNAQRQQRFGIYSRRLEPRHFQAAHALGFSPWVCRRLCNKMTRFRGRFQYDSRPTVSVSLRRALAVAADQTRFCQATIDCCPYGGTPLVSQMDPPFPLSSHWYAPGSVDPGMPMELRPN
jgi:hypothetical protein